MKYYKAMQYIDEPIAGLQVIIKDELLTTDEIKQYSLERYIENFKVVNIKPENTYYFFGARFEEDEQC